MPKRYRCIPSGKTDKIIINTGGGGGVGVGVGVSGGLSVGGAVRGEVGANLYCFQAVEGRGSIGVSGVWRA
jgi:hypothetical protein